MVVITVRNPAPGDHAAFNWHLIIIKRVETHMVPMKIQNMLKRKIFGSRAADGKRFLESNASSILETLTLPSLT